MADLTTLLSKFLQELYAGVFGTVSSISAIVLGGASTSGVRLDLESGVLAVREGDDSAYADMKAASLAFGTNPAASGELRLPNNPSGIKFRNAANNGDLVVMYVNTANTLILGENTPSAIQLGATSALVGLGGFTSSFPALKRSSTAVEVKLADDSAYAPLGASAYRLGASLVASSTAPTISSGFGTSPSVVTSNGTAAFTINVGTGGTASAGVIGLPTAPNGWLCHVNNLTGSAANRANQRTVQTASTTTSVSIQNQLVSTGAAQAWTASDVLQVICIAY